jgi:hypothetical protein
LAQIGSEDGKWINIVPNRVKWRVLVATAINLEKPFGF